MFRNRRNALQVYPHCWFMIGVLTSKESSSSHQATVSFHKRLLHKIKLPFIGPHNISNKFLHLLAILWGKFIEFICLG